MARDRRPRIPVTAAPRRTARALQRKGRAPSARRSGARSASVDAPRAAEASGPGARRRARRRRAAGASLRLLLRPSECAVNSLPQLPRLHAAGVRVGPLVLSYQAFRSSSVTASRVSCEMKCSKFCATEKPELWHHGWLGSNDSRALTHSDARRSSEKTEQLT